MPRPSPTHSTNGRTSDCIIEDLKEVGCCCGGKDDRDEDDMAGLMMVSLLLYCLGWTVVAPVVKQTAKRKQIARI